MKERKTLVILTNIMTPYRKFFYDELNNECKKNNINFYIILMAETEYGRHWKYDDFKTEYTILLPHKTAKFGNIEIHINTGLKKIYKQIKPDIVICGGSYLYPAVWRTIQLHKKMNFTIMEWSESHLHEQRNYNSIKLKIREFIRRKVISKFDGFWCAGEFSKEFVSKYAKKDIDYIFVPNLVDNNKFALASNISESKKNNVLKKYDLDKNKKIYITPARLTKVKGLIEFLNIYKDCHNENCTYLIAGDGELKEEITKVINDYNLDVKLLGYKNESDMIELYSISNGFILPSLSDPNPLSCIEACWCGLPLLVSSHVGNYPEIIKENKNGFVFDYKNLEEAKKKINSFLESDDSWYKNASETSYKIAKEIYNSKTVVERIISETFELYSRDNK